MASRNSFQRKEKIAMVEAIYKCRRCQAEVPEEISGIGDIGEGFGAAVAERLHNNPVTIHFCDEQNAGICDLQGVRLRH